MSLISRLGRRFREKPKSSSLKLPSLPTRREILEDIDSCQSNDSIIAFATLIQKKGRTSLLDIDLQEGPEANINPHLDFLTPYRTIEKTSEDSFNAGGKNASAKRKVSAGSNVSGSKSKKPVDAEEQINQYNKIKQFLLVCEKSEELMETLEPHFKKIENTLKECKSECVAKEDDTEEFHEQNNIDTCSSPLM